MKTDIKIISFENTKIQKNNSKGATLFLHQSYIGDEQQINKFLLECQDEPVVFHYFSHWFEKASLKEKIDSNMSNLILGAYFPDFKFKNIDFESGQAFLLDQVLCEKNIKVCHVPFMKYHPSFFLNSTVYIHDLTLLKKKYGGMDLVDEIEDEWLSTNQLTKSEPVPLDQSQMMHLIYCESKKMVLDAHQALSERQLNGIIYCQEEININNNDQIMIKKVAKGFYSTWLLYLIIKIRSMATSICVCLHWSSEMHQILDLEVPIIFVENQNTLLQRCFHNIINEIAKTKSIPAEFCDIAKIMAFKVNQRDLEATSIQNIWLSLAKLNIRKEFINNDSDSILDLKRKILIFQNVISSTYFSYNIMELISVSIPNTKIGETHTLDELQKTGRLVNNNIEEIINAILKEVVTQRCFFIENKRKIPNYEQIAFD